MGPDDVIQGIGSLAGQLDNLGGEVEGLSEKRLSAAALEAILAQNGGRAIEILGAQALTNRGDEALEYIINLLGQNPEFVRDQGAQMLVSIIADASGTERTIREQEAESAGNAVDRLILRHDDVQRMGMQPWEMQSTVVSLAAGLGKLIQLVAGSGLVQVSPQLNALAENLIQAGEEWAGYIEENAPDLGMDRDALLASLDIGDNLSGRYDAEGLRERSEQGLTQIIEDTSAEINASREELETFFVDIATALVDVEPEQRAEIVDLLREELGIGGAAVAPDVTLAPQVEPLPDMQQFQ